MTHLVTLFINNLLPIFLIAGVGYVLAMQERVDPHTMALVTFHAFSPCLVFHLIATSTLSTPDLARTGAFAAGVMLVPGAIAGLLAAALHLSRAKASALILVVTLSNVGNFGLPAVSLAFGDAALAHAAIFSAVSSVLTYTVGVVVASLGTSGWRTALLGVTRVPTIYAVALALVVRATAWAPPLPVDRAVTLMADAAIPAMIVVLGMQLRRNGSLRLSRLVWPAVGLRLVVAPAIAIVLVPLFALSGPARQACVLEAAMPTAVATTVLADTYGGDITFVTQAVVVSTLLAPLTLTPLLAWLGAG